MHIIKVGLADESKTKGCEETPNLLLKEFKKISSNELGGLIDHTKLKIGEIHTDTKNLAQADYLIFENSKEIIEKNFKSVFIGGDHSISFSILRAFMRAERDPLLILFDSHVDCLNNKIPDHGSWLRKLTENGFKPENIIIIGARNILPEEMEFLKENRILLIGMSLLMEDLEGICDLIMERARNSSGFYVSTDISVIDPAFAPGSYSTEPGGMISREMIYFLRRLKLLDNLKAADIVGINPLSDVNKMTVRLGSKLLAELI